MFYVCQSSLRGCCSYFVFVYFFIKVFECSPVPASFFPIYELRYSDIQQQRYHCIIYNHLLHLQYIALFLGTQILLHDRGGRSPQPPPMCSIHLDDAMATILRQNAHQTPAYCWRGDSDAANQFMGMISRP